MLKGTEHDTEYAGEMSTRNNQSIPLHCCLLLQMTISFEHACMLCRSYSPRQIMANIELVLLGQARGKQPLVGSTRTAARERSNASSADSGLRCLLQKAAAEHLSLTYPGMVMNLGSLLSSPWSSICKMAGWHQQTAETIKF